MKESNHPVAKSKQLFQCKQAVGTLIHLVVTTQSPECKYANFQKQYLLAVAQIVYLMSINIVHVIWIVPICKGPKIPSPPSHFGPISSWFHRLNLFRLVSYENEIPHFPCTYIMSPYWFDLFKVDGKIQFKYSLQLL